MGEGWYHCRSCRRKFTVRIGTIFEHSKIPLHKWLYALMFWRTDSPSGGASDLSRRLDITYRSARLMMDRIEEYRRPGGPPMFWASSRRRLKP